MSRGAGGGDVLEGESGLDRSLFVVQMMNGSSNGVNIEARRES